MSDEWMNNRDFEDHSVSGVFFFFFFFQGMVSCLGGVKSNLLTGLMALDYEISKSMGVIVSSCLVCK